MMTEVQLTYEAIKRPHMCVIVTGNSITVLSRCVAAINETGIQVAKCLLVRIHCLIALYSSVDVHCFHMYSMTTATWLMYLLCALTNQGVYSLAI